MQFDAIFAGKAVRRPKPQHHRFVDQLTLVDQRAIDGLARLDGFNGELL